MVLGFLAAMRLSKAALLPRKRPVQARSRRTVEWILEGAARVFRREGWDATTNRIAEAAGVSVGTLYEYFPNKEALLWALASRHVEVAEREIDAAIAGSGSTHELLASLQAAILASQRFPSEALALVVDVPRVGPDLQARAEALRARVLGAIAARLRRDRPMRADADLRARAIFGVIGELTARAMVEDPDGHEPLTRELLAMAVAHGR